MSQYRHAFSTAADWQQACSECLQQLGDTAEPANLAIIYLSDRYALHLDEILDKLKQASGIAHWVGSTAQGICSNNTEVYDAPAMAILVTDIDPAHFSVFNTLEPATSQHGDEYTLQLALVHADPRYTELNQALQQLPNAYLVGGLSSAENEYRQIADQSHELGMSGVIFENVEIITGLSQGCTPLGPVHTLTECDQHMAIRIDHQPALDVFKQDIGEILARNIDRAAGYIFAGFPIQGSDTGDYLVRNIIGIDPHNGLLAIGDYMQSGVPIMFCKRDHQSAVDDMQRMLNNIRQRLGNKTIKGGIYVSCLGRGRHLFGDNSEEVKIISSVLGEFPLVGFYANGEIAGQQLYGYTGVLSLFVE